MNTLLTLLLSLTTGAAEDVGVPSVKADIARVVFDASF